jgi:hypothetical protein
MCLRGNLEIESLIDQYVAQMLENPHVEGSKGLQARFKVVEMGHYQRRHEVIASKRNRCWSIRNLMSQFTSHEIHQCKSLNIY